MSNQRAGFTLIELLIVVVVIGILAAIAVVRYDRVRSNSFMAVTQSDLKNVATLQEFHHADNLMYAADAATLNAQLSPGVAVTVTHNTPTGWSAQATHSGDSNILCGVYVGTAPPAGGAPAPAPDQVICTN